MDNNNTDPGFRIWAADDVVYGPVELPMLIEWIQDERVEADTWIFLDHEQKWMQAGKIPDLGMFFRKKSPAGGDGGGGGQAKEVTPLVAGIKPGMLRRVKILSAMEEQDLGRFVQYMEVIQVRQFAEIFKKGEPGDSMFMVLEGEVRVRLMMGTKERILTTFPAGEFFGEMALFDQSPRSADIVANSDCVLLKVSVEKLENLCNDGPEIAVKFLLAICQTFSSRIRADNKRFQDTINFQQASSGLGG